MSILITDMGITSDDWTPAKGTRLDLSADADPQTADVAGCSLVTVDFPNFADGRGFTIARQLRLRGYRGRLRAQGHVLADQYSMARRAGFDEVEIPDDLAARQPQADWTARADWQAHDYQARLRG